MSKSFRTAAGIRSYTHLTLASLFLLFLVLSQPHRVHHFFEAQGHAPEAIEFDSENHDHGEEENKPAQAECVFQSVAQNCHLGQAALVQLSSAELMIRTFHAQPAPWINPFAHFAFLRRAPPQSALIP
jgi:hypothetical protein